MQAGSTPEHSDSNTQTKADPNLVGASCTCGQQDHRSEDRTTVEAQCELHLFDGPQATITKVSGVTQNLSFHGLAIVSEVADAARVGQAVEIVIRLADAHPMHVAGTIAFCRKIDFGKFEIGIHVRAAGQSPILIHDVKDSLEQYEWFAESLRSPG